MSRFAIILSLIVATITATTVNSSLDQLHEQFQATELTFHPVSVTIQVESSDETTVTYDDADNGVTEIDFHQPLFIEG
ncbi:MAG: hypothetical protein HQ488_02170 [Parcubacteria group bacterium]|nr:hypothetical protein [Parcubacteria group bacterium]